LGLIPVVGIILALAIGGCCAGLIAQGPGRGAAAGFLGLVCWTLAISLAGQYIAGMFLGVDIFEYLFGALTFVTLPAMFCMAAGGALGGLMNKPKEPIEVRVYKQGEEKRLQITPEVRKEVVPIREEIKTIECPFCGARIPAGSSICPNCMIELPR
jgi:hypothetical protein